MRHCMRIMFEANVAFISGAVLIFILLFLPVDGAAGNPPTSESWSEYRVHVLETLKNLDANINDMNKKLDELTGNVMTKTEAHSVAIGRLRAQNGMYAGGISLAMSALMVFGGGYVSRRIRFNGKVIEDGK